MQGGPDDIIKLLLDENYISKDDAEAAKKYAETYQAKPEEYLIREGALNQDLLGQAVAEYYNLPYADLNSNEPTEETVLKIPEEIARHNRVVIYDENDAQAVVATSNPNQQDLAELLASILGKNVTLAYGHDEEISHSFIHYRQPLDTRFSQIIEEQEKIAPEIVEEIIEDAVAYQASDIHFEPQKETVVIRFRIDGVLEEAGRLPKDVYESVINRIKVQAKMRIDEHNATQDGAIRYTLDDQEVDMRVSVAPTLEGEKVVIRLLTAYLQQYTLNNLGLSAEDQKVIEKTSKKPFGMIMVTGPTGSGKTTSLYSVLKYIYNPEINITTIEDPVEYRIQGVNQIQVNPEADITFAKGLRSIARQDPDVILVGEIRDEETAEIAVNAALTGHLMLSTFHANDAATAIPRLMDMGIEPFLLSSTLEMVVAQRLVRRIYEPCRVSREYSRQEFDSRYPELSKYFPGKKVTVYEAKSIPSCPSGFRGRMAVFEIIKVDSKMKELILSNPSRDQIWDQAKKSGAKSLFDDGIEKVKKGQTTIEELLRVVQVPEE